MNIFKIATPAGAASKATRGAADGLMKALRGEGKLNMSPIPVPYPRTSLTYRATHWASPLGLAPESRPDDQFRLPTDPLISVSGSNTVVMREIADGSIRGTVKERWQNADWRITISGILMTDERGTCDDYVRKLVELCDAREALVVTNEQLNNSFGVTHVAVTGVKFNTTDGLDNQLFVIEAVSDDSYGLEVE